MHAILGDGPLAHALARRLTRMGPTVLGSSSITDGPWLWRHADMATGQGVKAAIEGARLVVVALDDDAPTDGGFVVLKRVDRLHGVVALALDVPAPRALTGLADLSVVRVGPVWGPDEPWIAAWSRAALDGRRLLVPDVGPIRPVPADDAVDAILAAASHKGARWTVTGAEEARLTDLATTIGATLGKPARVAKVPLGLAAWWTGADPKRATRWAAMPPTPRATEGWTATRAAGRTGWARSSDAV